MFAAADGALVKVSGRVLLKYLKAKNKQDNKTNEGIISIIFITFFVWLNRQCLFLLNLPALVHDLGDKNDGKARN